MLRNELEAEIVGFQKAIELSPGYYAKAGENLKRARLNSRYNP